MWANQGVWKDEDMPEVGLIAASFFGWRWSLDYDLSEATEYLGEIREGWLDYDARISTWAWRNPDIIAPEIEIRVSVNQEEDYQLLEEDDRGVLRIPDIYGATHLRIRVFLRSDFIDVFPEASVRVYSITVHLTNRLWMDWTVKDRPTAEWVKL